MWVLTLLLYYPAQHFLSDCNTICEVETQLFRSKQKALDCLKSKQSGFCTVKYTLMDTKQDNRAKFIADVQ